MDHDASLVWLKLMKNELEGPRKYFSRFTGFINSHKDKNFLLEELHRHIEVINQDGRYYISDKVTDFGQEFSNKIHHHFEILAGDFDNPTEFFQASSPEVKRAVSGLNYCIHDLEAYTRNSQIPDEGHIFSAVVLEIKKCKRLVIPESFYELYTLNLDFGDMVLHYSQIGKTWLEAFLDKDEEVFDDGIRPQYAISGEFDILFGELHPDKSYMGNIKRYLESRGKDLRDPSLRLGHLPVAKLVNSRDKSEIKKEIGLRSDIKKISAMFNGKVIAEKVFNSSPSAY